MQLYKIGFLVSGLISTEIREILLYKKTFSNNVDFNHNCLIIMCYFFQILNGKNNYIITLQSFALLA